MIERHNDVTDVITQKSQLNYEIKYLIRSKFYKKTKKTFKNLKLDF